MAKGFKHGAGGGTPLNFKVVGYATEELLLAATPKENAIGCITQHDITGYHFATTQPVNMANGEICFFTGTLSPASFNALKKNNITVYPMRAQQMVDGALVDVKAKTYKNGAWADWRSYLYNAGDECIPLTGGWVFKNFGANSYTFNKNNDHISFTHGGGNDCIIYTAEPIDLSMYSTLHFVGQINQSNPSWTRLNIWSSIGGSVYDNVVACLSPPITESGMLNISNLSGEYIIGFSNYGKGSVTMNSLFLE